MNNEAREKSRTTLKRRAVKVHPGRTGMAVVLIALAVGCGGQTAGAPAAGAPSAMPSASSAPPPVASAPAAPAPTASAAPAAPPADTSAELSEGDEHRQRHHGGIVALIAMSLKDLDLTPEQKTAVEKIRTDLVAKMEPSRAAGKDLANVLADGVAAGAVNRTKADAAIDKLVAQVTKVDAATRDALNQLHAALTAQERADLVDKVQGHWEKWKEAHGQDEKDDGQHRSGYLLGLVKTLNLTPDEAQKIKASFQTINKAKPQEHQHKEVVDHLQAFATAFKADKFDAKKLASANAANLHLVKWGATRRARFLEAAAPILTPDQRTKLAQIIRDWGDKPES